MTAISKLMVLVAHDNPLLAAGLRAAFCGREEFEVSIGDSLLLARTANIVIADFDNGVRFAAEAGLATPVMIVSAESGEWATRKALEAGVRGYLPSHSPMESVLNGVRSIVRGGVVIDAFLASKVLNNLKAKRMTKREQAVLALLAQGLTDKAIASRLGNAVGTIKCHVKQIRRKLNAASRIEAILIAQRRGLLPREIPCHLGASVHPIQFKSKLPAVGGKPSPTLPVFSRRAALLDQHVER